jgi:DNA-binding beta-propeller fold protein YncE
MKKLPVLVILILCVVLFMEAPACYASPATSYTYSMDAKNRYIRTQDAYLPDRTITDLGLNKPEDIFINEQDYLFIADTGNKRILVYNTVNGRIVREIKHEKMVSPTGIYVTKDNEIYVADVSSSLILRFAENGEFIESFGRPTAPAYGTNDFNPMKVAVDEAGNMYVLAEGIYDGIIQLAYSGEFLGYFASNRVELTFVQKLQDLLFTEAQKKNLLGRSPITFSNITVDRSGILYSTTNGEDVEQAVKKHNTAGQSMFQDPVIATDDLIDLFVDSNGIIYAVSKAGLIFVYSTEGEFIYSFGAFNSMQDVSGIFSSLSSVAVDSKGNVWTVDNEKSFIQSFVPTEYSGLVYRALKEYNTGNYKQSISLWRSILKLNQMSVLAHNNIGKNLLFEQEYEEAMYHTEIAGNRFYYSQSYWEVRNIWLQKNLAYILLIGVGLYIISKAVGLINKKTGILAVPAGLVKRVYNIAPVKDTLYMFRFFTHPLDSFYEVKKGNQGSYLGATIVYLSTFAAFMISLVGKGFIYQDTAVEDIDYQANILGFFAITLLFVLCNYLVSSINDGEGKLGHLYKMLCYSMGPLLVSMILTTIASHFLTLNEVFFLQMISMTGILWTGLLIVLGVQENHNYDTRVAFKSILMTILFMLIIIVVLMIIIIMAEQLYQFVESIVKEAIRNVTR